MENDNIYNLIFNPSIDLRSPTEYNKGTIPNSVNIPILDDDEYREVGTIYKTNGKVDAINLGKKIVSGEKKRSRIALWTEYIQNNHNCFVFCHKGGLRSKIAYSWITKSSVDVKRLEDGYKSYRKMILSLHDKIENYKGRWIILGGFTGSGKTRILNDFKESINLESIANHRGSAFGKTGKQQPSQANFESLITEKYLKKKNSNIILLEDESKLIGKTKLPGKWYDKMQMSELILLDCNLETRSKNIYDEYVKFSSNTKIDIMELWSYYLAALKKIRKRLGDDHYKNIKNILNNAFKNSDEGLHLKWIKILLEKYYDRMYGYKLKLRNKHVIFKGNEMDCRNFITNIIVDNQ